MHVQVVSVLSSSSHCSLVGQPEIERKAITNKNPQTAPCKVLFKAAAPSLAPFPAATGKGKGKVKVKVHTLDIASLRSESPPQKRSGMASVLEGFHSFTCTCTHTFIRNRNEPYLPSPSQLQLVLIYRPRRDGRPIDLGAK